jgi:pimeloyl-ACP methyl ester carboxylesterase
VRAVEGRIPFRGFETWYRDVGPEDGVPLLCLHGGPGSTHNYFEPLEQLAGRGRRVVVYDQLGCGNSDRPDDPELWTLALFLDEVQTVRDELGLERIHLLGTSWGSILALEYVLGKPADLVSLTLNAPPTAAETWAAEAGRLRAPLAEDEAVAETQFARRHVCRLDPLPECVERGLAGRNRRVYRVMWGEQEWRPTGRLRDWDVRPRLPEIDLPTLITSGRHDICTPQLAETARRGIAGSEWVLFEESSHTAFVEEPERYRAVLIGFLDRAEAA